MDVRSFVCMLASPQRKRRSMYRKRMFPSAQDDESSDHSEFLVTLSQSRSRDSPFFSLLNRIMKHRSTAGKKGAKTVGSPDCDRCWALFFRRNQVRVHALLSVHFRVALCNPDLIRKHAVADRSFSDSHHPPVDPLTFPRIFVTAEP